MLFNSFEYIFLFVPISLFIYFSFGKYFHHKLAPIILTTASLFFYSYWKISFLPVLIISIIINYLIGSRLQNTKNSQTNRPKFLLFLGISFNILLLVYFKYIDFIIKTINQLFLVNIELLHVTLPLAISFFTFQQIAFITDAYYGKSNNDNFFNYSTFVSFFPQLIAGPIVHHKEMMPQFNDPINSNLNIDNITKGLFIFSIGLFKKIIIADALSSMVASGFDHSNALTLIEAWLVSLSYTFQIYFDFSGYTDMAIGAALFFNIKLPVNFDSPYKAINIQEFWRKWHITLSRFLRDYLYIPLGGNRTSVQKTYFNVIVTFLLGGLWHGAGWTFVAWGLLHGLCLVAYRFIHQKNLQFNRFVSWLLTFVFVNMTWIFFRAQNFHDALKVLKGFCGMNGLQLPSYFKQFELIKQFSFITFGDLFPNMKFDERGSYMLLLSIITCFFFKNSNQLLEKFEPNYRNLFLSAFCFIISILWMDNISEFIYFNF